MWRSVQAMTALKNPPHLPALASTMRLIEGIAKNQWRAKPAIIWMQMVRLKSVFWNEHRNLFWGKRHIWLQLPRRMF